MFLNYMLMRIFCIQAHVGSDKEMILLRFSTLLRYKFYPNPCLNFYNQRGKTIRVKMGNQALILTLDDTKTHYEPFIYLWVRQALLP